MKYRVDGWLEAQFTTVVEADSREDAEDAVRADLFETDYEFLGEVLEVGDIYPEED